MIKHFVILGTYGSGNVVPWLEPDEAWAQPHLKLFDSRATASLEASQTPFGQHYGFTVYTTEVPE